MSKDLHNVEINDLGELGIQLTLNLEPYAKWQNDKNAHSNKKDQKSKSSNNINPLEEATSLLGAFIWKDIQTILVAKLKKMPEDYAQRFAKDLTLQRNLPSSIIAFQECFVEFLKNSVDAKINNNSTLEPVLIINLKFHLTEHRFNIIYTDNSGGFSKTYLNTFKNYLNNKTYLEQHPKTNSSKSNGKSLGGFGLGMHKFCQMLFNDHVHKNAKGKENSLGCSIRLSNINTNDGMGAKIKVSSILENKELKSQQTNCLKIVPYTFLMLKEKSTRLIQIKKQRITLSNI